MDQRSNDSNSSMLFNARRDHACQGCLRLLGMFPPGIDSIWTSPRSPLRKGGFCMEGRTSLAHLSSQTDPHHCCCRFSRLYEQHGVVESIVLTYASIMRVNLRAAVSCQTSTPTRCSFTASAQKLQRCGTRAINCFVVCSFATGDPWDMYTAWHEGRLAGHWCELSTKGACRYHSRPRLRVDNTIAECRSVAPIS